MSAIIDSVQVGQVAPLGPMGLPSAFVKRAVSDKVLVSFAGLSGDAQADLSVHGGPEKAVYGYAASNYAHWKADLPQHSELFVAGGMGENLTISGIKEAEMNVGDVHRAGTALLQVCQPRQPCYKLAAYFADPKLPRAMVRTGRAGWYYRVLEQGSLWRGCDLVLEDRPTNFAFARLVEIVNGAPASPTEISTLIEMPELASTLQESFFKRRS